MPPGLNVVNDGTGDGIIGATSDASGFAIHGVSSRTGTPSHYFGSAAVYGESEFPDCAGVYGVSARQNGVVGQGTQYGVLGTSGAVGVAGAGGFFPNTPSVGVFGFGTIGVKGVSSRVPGTQWIGILGSSDAESSIGVAGDSELGTGVSGFSRAGIGVRASTDTSHPDRAGWALLTDGDVLIGGTIYTAPGFPKGAVAKLSDGSHRALYCVESPECWFEDFGRARLVRGKAQVRLDRIFAAVVRAGDYHVFLSPEGLSHGLYISRRTRDGFEVREQHRGTSTVPFSYRIVARRKDVDAPRFKRVKLPTIPKIPRPSKVKSPKIFNSVPLPRLRTSLGPARGRKPLRAQPRPR